MRAALKLLGIVLGVVVLLLGGAAGYIYTQQDAIIAGGVAKINEQLKAPVSVGEISLDLLGGFPRVRIALNDVRIEDPLRKDAFLLQAQYVGLGMNLLSVIKGAYIIEELSLIEGRLDLYNNGSASNWELFSSNEDDASTSLGLDRVELQNLALAYLAPEEGIDYKAYAKSAVLSGIIDDAVALSGRADLVENELRVDRKLWVREAAFSGAFAFNSEGDHWEITSSKINANGALLSGSLNQDGGELALERANLLPILKSLPLLEFEDIDIEKFYSLLRWNGTYEKWALYLQPVGSAFSYKGIAISDFGANIDILWDDVPSISIENIALKTTTGELRGTASLGGSKPLLSANLEGGSNLSELFDFVEVETLINPMGFWSGSELTIAQRFNNWDDFEPIGATAFDGKVKLKEVSFGISESNINFENLEAELIVNGNDIRIDRCFMQSGPNNAVATGVVKDALNGRPQVTLRLESPTIDADPLLFWEFEDSQDKDEDFGFDFEVELFIDNLNLGKFDGKGLRGTVFNNGTKLLGKQMRIDGCGGTFRGNWALAEEQNGSRFWSSASCTTIEMDQLLQSFDSFDIEDLDESNLKGTVNATAEMTFHFDTEWDVISERTNIDAQAELRNGSLQNYAPLQELSAFVDRDELARIDFPYLKGPFQIRGDTLIIPETKVDNSAINFWVNGWQNLETDDIYYSIRIGLKDLALRGKNSNRDLGSWVAEAETENQPYMRLRVGCNLDDPCISLDRQQIRTSLKQSVQQEKEDLKTLFKRDDDRSDDQRNKGDFELLWEESDSLSVRPF